MKNLVLDFLIESNAAFSTVRLPTFKKLLEGIKGGPVDMPSTESMTKSLKNDYTNLRMKLQALLNQQLHVCTTADVWTKRARSYLGVTVHFIDSDYERHSYLLVFRRLNKRVTNDYLAELLFNINEEFNLSITKITHTITDGGSNFCAAFRNFGTQNEAIEHSTIELEHHDDNDSETDTEDENIDLTTINDDGDDTDDAINECIDQLNVFDELVTMPGVQVNVLNLNDPRSINDESISGVVLPSQLRCFAHQLNTLGRSDFLKYLKEIDKEVHKLFTGIYAKLKKLWKKFSANHVAKLIVIQVLGCSLIIPVMTRWNSEIDSIEKAAIHKDGLKIAIQRINNETGSNLEKITSNEWLIMSDYVKLMKPVAVGLDKLQGEEKSPAGTVLPCLHFIKRELQKVQLTTEIHRMLVEK